jgi:hypothetical protein
MMLLHAVFGCCWHHEHGVHAHEAGGVETALSQGDAQDQDGGGQHASHVDDGAETPDDEHDHDCGTEICRFLSPGPVQPPLAEILWVGAAHIATGHSPVPAIAASDEAGHTNSGRRGFAPPLRALSRLCVWRV